ncbi:hypothetical protein Vretifemale_14790 [Volvox reticuliferus]|uniref:Uncharacterized protein n=1 Tax=Volvox reticuliferus TaxID=1737510 RepID=A0A8J4CTK7_9CHLO|nr:hypothetical protein Vretifemale_14790 [Volvox reticuliferus]
MEAVYKGRALPPRPSLLVGKAGDIEACRSSWAQLQPVATELLRRAEAGCASVEDLDNAVRRFRSLRESLVAAYVRDEMAVQVPTQRGKVFSGKSKRILGLSWYWYGDHPSSSIPFRDGPGCPFSPLKSSGVKVLIHAHPMLHAWCVVS